MHTPLPPPNSVAAIKPASAHALRSKFLSVVGIESKKLPPKGGTVDNNAPEVVDKDWMHPRTQNLNYQQEALKYDKVADEEFTIKRRKLEPRHKRIGFNEAVVVVPIPMRQEYSNRVRQRLWSSAAEIHENAARNTLEFAAEGYVTD